MGVRQPGFRRDGLRTAILAIEGGAGVDEVPRVKVTPAVAVDGGRSLTLPGSLVAIRQAAINARATGYVRTWRADIGDRVTKGYVLAEIETPEVGQQLDQARAASAAIAANVPVSGKPGSRGRSILGAPSYLRNGSG